MRLDSLIHLASAVVAMAEAERVIVFGLAALLATYPELGELPDSPLHATYDVDLIPFPFEDEIGVMLDEAFGEDRTFHQRYGYHADIVCPKVAELFPKGWEQRLIQLNGDAHILCLEPHDMACAKCVAARPKDRVQLLYLLKAEMLDAALIKDRLETLSVDSGTIAKAQNFLAEMVSDR